MSVGPHYTSTLPFGPVIQQTVELKRYEFKEISVSVFAAPSDIIHYLTVQQQDGWELVQSVRLANNSVSQGGEYICLLFRRQVR